jgi:hypothetical protein
MAESYDMEDSALRHRRADDDEGMSGLPSTRDDDVREVSFQPHRSLHADLILKRTFLTEHGGEDGFLCPKSS